MRLKVYLWRKHDTKRKIGVSFILGRLVISVNWFYPSDYDERG